MAQLGQPTAGLPCSVHGPTWTANSRPAAALCMAQLGQPTALATAAGKGRSTCKRTPATLGCLPPCRDHFGRPTAPATAAGTWVGSFGWMRLLVRELFGFANQMNQFIQPNDPTQAGTTRGRRAHAAHLQHPLQEDGQQRRQGLWQAQPGHQDLLAGALAPLVLLRAHAHAAAEVFRGAPTGFEQAGVWADH